MHAASLLFIGGGALVLSKVDPQFNEFMGNTSLKVQLADGSSCTYLQHGRCTICFASCLDDISRQVWSIVSTSYAYGLPGALVHFRGQAQQSMQSDASLLLLTPCIFIVQASIGCMPIISLSYCKQLSDYVPTCACTNETQHGTAWGKLHSRSSIGASSTLFKQLGLQVILTCFCCCVRTPQLALVRGMSKMCSSLRKLGT